MGITKQNFSAVVRIIIFSIYLFIIPSSSYGWLTEEAEKEIQDLIENTSQEGDCPDPERLTFLIAFNGLSYLDQVYLDLIGEEFQYFSTIIANSQKPPQVPNCWVQAIYRKHANASQREEMLVALRSWLTEDISEARSGNLVGSDPASIVQGVIEAAECLVEWRDESAADSIREYLSRETVHERFRQQLEDLEVLLRDPCARSLFRILPGDQPLVCLKTEDLPNVELQSYDFRNIGKSVYFLSQEEKNELVDLINNSHVGINLPKGNLGESHYFVLRFENGYQACIQIPSNGTDAVFYDNGPSEFCPHVFLRNANLYRWGHDLVNKRMSKPNN